MSCLITSGITLGCRDSVGGVAEVYIGNFNGPSMTLTIASSTASNAGQVTAFGGATTSMFKIEQALETSSWSNPGEFSTENFTALYTPTVEIVLNKLTATLGDYIKTLGQGVWRIMVKTQTGDYFLLGYNNGMRVSAATPGVGKAMGDLNGATLTFTGKEQLPYYQVTTAAALTLITA